MSQVMNFRTVRQRGSDGRTEDSIIVLAPTRARTDSSVVLCHTAFSWLTNAWFCLMLLAKLTIDSYKDWSWWLVCLPFWVQFALQLPLQVTLLVRREHYVDKQLGPPPPESASRNLHLHYEAFRAARNRSHVIDASAALVEITAFLCTEITVCAALEARGHETLGTWTDVRLLLLPMWVGWLSILLMSCAKPRQERTLGSVRDLQFILLMFVSIKLDLKSGYPWTVVFLIPWMWFGALLLLATLVGAMLLFARFWRRMRELLLPIGFFLVLVATTPQAVSYIYLVRYLDGADGVTEAMVLIPNACGWVLMWAASIVLAAGLRRKERARHALLQSGAVWTAHSQIAARNAAAAAAAEMARIDAMSDEDVAALAEEMMVGQPKPGALYRAGQHLFRRIALEVNEAVTGEPPAVPPPDGDKPQADALLPADTHPLSGTTDALLAAQERAPREHQRTHGSARTPADGGGAHACPADDGTTLPSTVDLESPMTAFIGAVSVGTDVELAALGQQHDRTHTSTTSSPRSGADAVTTPSAARLELMASRESTKVSLPGSPESVPASEADTDARSAAPPDVEAGVADSPDGIGDPEDCVICYEATACCVLLECGHGGFCKRCAYKLFTRHPRQCPTCREPITQVVQLATAGAVGATLAVRQ